MYLKYDYSQNQNVLQSEITDFPTLSYTWDLTKAPHSGEPPRKDHYRGYIPPHPTPPHPPRAFDCWHSSDVGVNFMCPTIGGTKQRDKP